MTEVPAVYSNDNEIAASTVEFRKNLQSDGDWYVTWVSKARPWEVSVMRLATRESQGRAWHHGRSVRYDVNWERKNVTARGASAYGVNWFGALAVQEPAFQP